MTANTLDTYPATPTIDHHRRHQPPTTELFSPSMLSAESANNQCYHRHRFHVNGSGVYDGGGRNDHLHRQAYSARLPTPLRSSSVDYLPVYKRYGLRQLNPPGFRAIPISTTAFQRAAGDQRDEFTISVPITFVTSKKVWVSTIGARNALNNNIDDVMLAPAIPTNRATESLAQATPQSQQQQQRTVEYRRRVMVDKSVSTSDLHKIDRHDCGEVEGWNRPVSKVYPGWQSNKQVASSLLPLHERPSNRITSTASAKLNVSKVKLRSLDKVTFPESAHQLSFLGDQKAESCQRRARQEMCSPGSNIKRTGNGRSMSDIESFYRDPLKVGNPNMDTLALRNSNSTVNGKLTSDRMKINIKVKGVRTGEATSTNTGLYHSPAGLFERFKAADVNHCTLSAIQSPKQFQNSILNQVYQANRGYHRETPWKQCPVPSKVPDNMESDNKDSDYSCSGYDRMPSTLRGLQLETAVNNKNNRNNDNFMQVSTRPSLSHQIANHGKNYENQPVVIRRTSLSMEGKKTNNKSVDFKHDLKLPASSQRTQSQLRYHQHNNRYEVTCSGKRSSSHPEDLPTLTINSLASHSIQNTSKQPKSSGNVPKSILVKRNSTVDKWNGANSSGNGVGKHGGLKPVKCVTFI